MRWQRRSAVTCVSQSRETGSYSPVHRIVLKVAARSNLRRYRTGDTWGFAAF